MSVTSWRGSQVRLKPDTTHRALGAKTDNTLLMATALTENARAAAIAELRNLLGDRCSTNATQLEHHSRGESWHAPALPTLSRFADHR